MNNRYIFCLSRTGGDHTIEAKSRRMMRRHLDQIYSNLSLSSLAIKTPEE